MSTITQGIELFSIFAETWGKEKAQVIVRDIEAIIDSRKHDLATKGDILEVKRDILEVKREIKELELKIEQAKSSTIKWVVGWMVGLIIAQTAAITTIFLLLK
ncbi:MAG: hypothetical protein AB1611_03125 [bacterium]